MLPSGYVVVLNDHVSLLDDVYLLYCCFVVVRVKVILGGATVLEAVLHNVLFFRQSKASGSESTEVKIPQQPPWTTSEGSSGIISIITEQVRCGHSY